MAVSHVKSNPVANMTGTVTVFNSAGVTTTAAATDLVRPTDWNSAHNQFVTIGGNTAGASTLSGTNIEFHGGNNVTLSGDGQTIVFSAPSQSVQTQGSVQVQGSTGAISFGNGNGITFGGNASTITASHNGLTTARASNDAIGLNTALTGNGVAWTVNSSGLSLSVPAFLTTAAQSNHSHGNPTLALTNLSGTTASNSAGLTLSLSAAAPGGGGGVGLSAGTQSVSTGTVEFANSNGVTFGMSGSSRITASYTVPSPTVTVNAVSNTTQNSSGTVNLSGLSFQGAGVASVGLSNGSVVISVPSGGGAGDGGNVIAAGTQTGTSLGTIKFENSNGITFGMSGSTQVTASHNGLTTAAQSDHSHGNPTLALTNLNGTTASNSAGLTLSLSAAQSVQPVAVSGQNGSYAFSTLSLSNANGISFGTSAGSAITASHNALTSQSNQALSGSNGSFTFQTATFGNLNGISFYTSNGSLVASHNGLTTARASNDAIGLNSAFTAGPMAMTINSSGLSLNAASAAGTTSGFTGGASISGSMTHNTAGLALSLSHPAWLTTAAQSNHSHGNPTLALTNLSGTTASASNGLTISLSAAAPGGGGVTPVASASNGSFSFTTLAFSNANNVTFGTSAGSIITASVAAPGAAAEQNAINLLGANTAGNTTATGSTIGMSGLNLTLSGTNASQLVISAPATSSLVGAGGITISTAGSTISISRVLETATMWWPFNEAVNVAGQVGNASWNIVPIPTPPTAAGGIVSVDRLCLPMVISNSTNSTGSVTVSYSFGLYTRTASSISLAHSTTGTLAATFSGTVNNSTFAGVRLFTIPWSTSFEEGRYYVAIASRTTTGGGNCTVNQMLRSEINSNFSGLYGANSNRSHQWPIGVGVYSASSTAFPNSIAFSQIDGTNSLAARQPSWFMVSGTA